MRGRRKAIFDAVQAEAGTSPEIAHRLCMDSNTVSAQLHSLWKGGKIERTARATEYPANGGPPAYRYFPLTQPGAS